MRYDFPYELNENVYYIDTDYMEICPAKVIEYKFTNYNIYPYISLIYESKKAGKLSTTFLLNYSNANKYIFRYLENAEIYFNNFCKHTEQEVG